MTKERCACSTNSTRLFVESPAVVETTRSQAEGESLRWPTPGCNDSAFQALPTELLVEICKHLGWEDVFAIRRVSTLNTFLRKSLSVPGGYLLINCVADIDLQVLF
jgi:hypothetical protein